MILWTANGYEELCSAWKPLSNPATMISWGGDHPGLPNILEFILGTGRQGSSPRGIKQLKQL